MKIRESEKRTKNIKFNGKEIELAAKMLETLQTTIEIVYYLMENENEESFVLMLITANDIDLQALLAREKRDTDILFEIDKEEALYVILCQDTKVDGGYRFAERIIRNILLDKGNKIYCTELEIKATHYGPKKVILKLLETFIKSKQMNKSGEIIFRSLH
ncbi:hypothetical protein [Sulfurovum sp.]|uniref:hypothetical protein n=1 Tax=Sulfurovum sp. TaxID=1969726 RepID=UPI00286806D8|nr:hypothetical protein [Sulfurovum sp.]